MKRTGKRRDTSKPRKVRGKSRARSDESSTAITVTGLRCARCGGEAVTVGRITRCRACKSFVKGNKAARRHGVDEYQRRGVLPADLRPEIEAFNAQLLADQGGAAECSALRMGLVRRITETEAICRLLALDLATHGVLSPRGRMRGSTSAYLSAVDRFNKLASALGLERRQKKVADLESFLAQRGQTGERTDA